MAAPAHPPLHAGGSGPDGVRARPRSAARRPPLARQPWRRHRALDRRRFGRVHGRPRRAPLAALGETGVRVLVGLVAGAHLRHRRGRAGPPCSAGARRHRAVEPAAAGRREAPAFSVVRSFGVSAASTERCALSFTRLSVHLFYGAVLVTLVSPHVLA